MKKIILYTIGTLIVLLPLALVHINTPSHNDIQSKKDIKAGTIKTLNGSELEIHLVWGNLFQPRSVHRDMGFDLVGISCYFDPLRIQEEQVLPTNPLLNSAIYESLRSEERKEREEEIRYLLSKIIEALEYSKEVISCFMNKPRKEVCEGDQIVPYFWNSFRNSDMSEKHGIKYLSALPLFNPDLLYGRLSEKETRNRLSENVKVVIRRLINLAADKLHPTVHSIGLAVIGSTSHRGGDSRYFLEFKDGFISILKGIENSRPSSSLDRIYLVAFDQHQGVFKDDVLKGLQRVKQYLYLNELRNGETAKLIAGILTILYFIYCLLSYQNYERILKQDNRWSFVGTLTGTSGLAVGTSWAASISISKAVQLDTMESFWFTYLLLSISCLIGIRWMGKHIDFYKRKPRFRKT